MIFIFRIGPVFGGAFLLIFAGYVLFSRGEHDHVVLARAIRVGMVFFGVMVLLNMLRLVWRAFLAFFSRTRGPSLRRWIKTSTSSFWAPFRHC